MCCTDSPFLLQAHTYSKLQFFEKKELYWTPSSQPAELYSQLAKHKYREIFRNQIRSVAVFVWDS